MKLSFGKPVADISGQDDLDALMPWERDGKHNIYNRAKLYDEVWSKPVQQVAAQFWCTVSKPEG